MGSYNPYSLSGKTILVTGGSSGIGRATAIECSKLGASVVIVGRNEAKLNETLTALDDSEAQRHTSIVADLTTPAGITQITEANACFDGVFSNAGISTNNKPLKFIKEKELESIFSTNLFSHVMLVKALIKGKQINRGGSYVFTASAGGNYSFNPGLSVYGMSKAAVNSLMRFCAVELAPRDIRCNSVCPGMIITPMTQANAVLSDEDYANDTEHYLLRRYGQPEEVAHVVAFLLSDAASFVDGTAIAVDGGLSVNH